MPRVIHPSLRNLWGTSRRRCGHFGGGSPPSFIGVFPQREPHHPPTHNPDDTRGLKPIEHACLKERAHSCSGWEQRRTGGLSRCEAGCAVQQSGRLAEHWSALRASMDATNRRVGKDRANRTPHGVCHRRSSPRLVAALHPHLQHVDLGSRTFRRSPRDCCWPRSTEPLRWAVEAGGASASTYIRPPSPDC